jgi:hypothetical protein
MSATASGTARVNIIDTFIAILLSRTSTNEPERWLTAAVAGSQYDSTQQ